MAGQTLKIEKLINMLHHPKAGRRYEACEELRVTPEISEEAKTALQELLNDPDPEVADAVRRVLKVHLGESVSPLSVEITDNSPGVPPQTSQEGLLFLVGMAITGINAVIGSLLLIDGISIIVLVLLLVDLVCFIFVLNKRKINKKYIPVTMIAVFLGLLFGAGYWFIIALLST